MHTYRKSKGEELWTVGFEMPSENVHEWRPIKDFNEERQAAAYTSYLNGGAAPGTEEETCPHCDSAWNEHTCP